MCSYGIMGREHRERGFSVGPLTTGYAREQLKDPEVLTSPPCLLILIMGRGSGFDHLESHRPLLILPGEFESGIAICFSVLIFYYLLRAPYMEHFHRSD